MALLCTSKLSLNIFYFFEPMIRNLFNTWGVSTPVNALEKDWLQRYEAYGLQAAYDPYCGMGM